jgi:hypothetical protein
MRNKMQIVFGKHAGTTFEDLVLKEPAYVVWMLNHPEHTGERACAEAKRLLDIFDKKPFITPCSGSGCNNQATRCSLYEESIQPRWWCNKCDPYSMGAKPGSLFIRQYYIEAWAYVHYMCNRRKRYFRELLRDMARAKGLPWRAGKQEVQAFFGTLPNTLDSECA